MKFQVFHLLSVKSAVVFEDHGILNTYYQMKSVDIYYFTHTKKKKINNDTTQWFLKQSN